MSTTEPGGGHPEHPCLIKDEGRHSVPTEFEIPTSEGVRSVRVGENEIVEDDVVVLRRVKEKNEHGMPVKYGSPFAVSREKISSSDVQPGQVILYQPKGKNASEFEVTELRRNPRVVVSLIASDNPEEVITRVSPSVARRMLAKTRRVEESETGISTTITTEEGSEDAQQQIRQELESKTPAELATMLSQKFSSPEIIHLTNILLFVDSSGVFSGVAKSLLVASSTNDVQENFVISVLQENLKVSRERMLPIIEQNQCVQKMFTRCKTFMTLDETSKNEFLHEVLSYILDGLVYKNFETIDRALNMNLLQEPFARVLKKKSIDTLFSYYDKKYPRISKNVQQALVNKYKNDDVVYFLSYSLVFDWSEEDVIKALTNESSPVYSPELQVEKSAREHQLPMSWEGLESYIRSISNEEVKELFQGIWSLIDGEDENDVIDQQMLLVKVNEILKQDVSQDDRLRNLKDVFTEERERLQSKKILEQIQRWHLQDSHPIREGMALLDIIYGNDMVQDKMIFLSWLHQKTIGRKQTIIKEIEKVGFVFLQKVREHLQDIVAPITNNFVIATKINEFKHVLSVADFDWDAQELSLLKMFLRILREEDWDQPKAIEKAGLKIDELVNEQKNVNKEIQFTEMTDVRDKANLIIYDPLVYSPYKKILDFFNHNIKTRDRINKKILLEIRSIVSGQSKYSEARDSAIKALEEMLRSIKDGRFAVEEGGETTVTPAPPSRPKVPSIHSPIITRPGISHPSPGLKTRPGLGIADTVQVPLSRETKKTSWWSMKKLASILGLVGTFFTQSSFNKDAAERLKHEDEQKKPASSFQNPFGVRDTAKEVEKAFQAVKGAFTPKKENVKNVEEPVSEQPPVLQLNLETQTQDKDVYEVVDDQGKVIGTVTPKEPIVQRVPDKKTTPPLIQEVAKKPSERTVADRPDVDLDETDIVDSFQDYGFEPKVIKKGDSPWRLIAESLRERFGERFESLPRGSRIYVIDYIKDAYVKLKYGVDKKQVKALKKNDFRFWSGDSLDLNKILDVTGITLWEIQRKMSTVDPSSPFCDKVLLQKLNTKFGK